MLHHFHPSRPSFWRLASSWARRREQSAITDRRHPRPTDPEALPSLTVMSADARLDHVVDPDDAVWVFRVVGRATLRTIDEIDRLTVTLGTAHTVHVDLYDAEIPSGAVMGELERLAERLERAMVRVRMVGVDPNHPALGPHR